MASHTGVAPALAISGTACRLVVRREPALPEAVKFMVAGLEVSQQVVALGGPRCLKEIASGLGENGFRPDALLRNGRLVFLTAPECLNHFVKPTPAFERTMLRRNGAVMRWVTDWSWAYGNGLHSDALMAYQKLVHDYVRTLTPLTLCTVHLENPERSSILAMLADHRRAAKFPHQT
jgi:DcmR-like sensory protein